MARQFLILMQGVLILSMLSIANAQSPVSRPASPSGKAAPRASWTSADLESVGMTSQVFREMGLASLTQKQYASLVQWIRNRDDHRKKDPSLYATWTPYVEKNYDITEEKFGDMGLPELTVNQYVNLLLWLQDREQKVKNSVPQQALDCDRPGTPFSSTPPEAYDKVHVNVTASGEATQIISGVRERLRTMDGVEVVYSDDDADLTVSMLAMNLTNVGGYHTGVAASIDVTQPCAYKVNTSSVPYQMQLDQFMEVGSNISDLVNEIVSTIDTRSLDAQRAQNARYKKMLQGQKN